MAGRYKEGDRFIIRIDRVIDGNIGLGPETIYECNSILPGDDQKLVGTEGITVTEQFLDSCGRMEIVCDNEPVKLRTRRLELCPFCGCEMHLRRQTMADGRTIRFEPVGEHKRGCQLRYAGGMYVGNPTTIEGAVKLWNRRYQEDGNE